MIHFYLDKHNGHTLPSSGRCAAYPKGAKCKLLMHVYTMHVYILRRMIIRWCKGSPGRHGDREPA